MKQRPGLSASSLKIMACVLMVIDHIGMILFPEIRILRQIGRLAFPIFAFFIAEGCRYTRHPFKRLAMIAGMGALCETAYILFIGEWNGNILVTFTFSILLTMIMQAAKRAAAKRWVFTSLAFMALFSALCVVVWVFDTVWGVDYGLFGALCPVAVAFCDYREGEAPRVFRHMDRLWIKLCLLGVMLIMICVPRMISLPLDQALRGYSQPLAVLALPILALYNGKPGKKGLKYGFYIFYPAHLALLQCIAWLVG